MIRNEIVIGDKKAYLFETSNNGENFNFHDYLVADYGVQLVIEGGWDNEFISLLEEKIDVVSISSLNDNVDVSFISKHLPLVKQLFINCNSVINTGVISTLNSLEYLSFSCNKNTNISFELPKGLKCFVIDWKTKYEFITYPNTLEYLSITKGVKIDWEKLFESCKKLEKLDLEKCDIVDGSQVFSLLNLKFLNIDSCKEVKFSGLKTINNSLKYLYLTKVNILNIDFLSELNGLDILILESCGDIENIFVLNNLKLLRGVYLSGNTNIINGNLNALKNLDKLRNCFITHKKHYSLKSKESWNWKNFTLPRKELFQ